MSNASDEAIERYAKILVANCVRNTFLEDIHAGDADLGEAEMTKLMREITNKVFTFLKFANDQKFMDLMALGYPKEWEPAEMDADFVAAAKQTSGAGKS